MTSISRSSVAHVDVETSGLARPLPGFADVFRSSLWLTLACTGGIAVLASQSARSFPFWCKLFMYVLGFTHFAVGYVFMAYGASRLTFGWKGSVSLGVCVALGFLYYATPPTLFMPATTLLYTVVFCHFAENAVYHAYRRPDPGRAITLEGVFPLVAGLVALRGVSVWRAGEDLVVNGAAMVAFLALLRRRVPGADWRAGWRALGQHLPLAALFGGVALFLRDSMILWDVFIIWHYVTWIVYQWGGAPALRPRLVWTHVAFGSVYVTLVAAVALGVLKVPPDMRWIFTVVVGPLAFYAQTMTHNLVALVFRQYAPRA